MTSKERVLTALRGQQPDRVPLNVFAGWNPPVRQRVNQKYGSVEGFCERFQIDIVTAVLPRFPFGRGAFLGAESFDPFLDAPWIDPYSEEILTTPCDGDLFLTVEEALQQRGDRAVFAHVWGVFELSQFLFEREVGQPGIEQALLNMALERDKAQRIYERLGEWSAGCVENAIRAGVDVIELSDDWGQQNALMFSPDDWWELIMPAMKPIVDAAKQHGVPVLVHSDGDISSVLDGVVELGVDAVHPVQESSGMDALEFKRKYGDRLSVMGGLDTITALPRMSPEEIRAEVRRVFGILKPGGGYIFCASHMFQADSPLEVVEAAYDEALKLAPYPID
jgi:uroporphyrinogen decarboxylase